MSWDVWIIKFEEQYQSVRDIPDGVRPLCLGTRDEIQKKISSVFAGTDWNDPAWGAWSSKDGSIEFNIGNEDVISSIMLHVRAEDTVVPLIIKLALDNGWQASDTSDGLFLERKKNPTGELQKWRKYRDKIAKKLK